MNDENPAGGLSALTEVLCPVWDSASEAMLHLNDIEALLGGRNGATIMLRAAIEKMSVMNRDAMRYRWLRDIGDATWRPFGIRAGYSADMADSAIDKAMAHNV